MPTTAPTGPRAVEIACDESGYEGEKLVGGVTDVFAHASVRLDEQTAAACVAELRARIKSPATMYKAGHLLRSKHRAVLLWFLGPDGPLEGNAHVFLVDKTYFLVSALVDFLGARSETIRFLYDAGRRTAEARVFLEAANDFVRATDESPIPRLDPLMPAIVRAVEFWTDGGQAVAIAHDRQTTLSAERVGRLQQSTEGFAALEQVDSFTDHRIQIADFLAGITRKIASDQLRGADDAEVSVLLAPYLDKTSVWPAWVRLAD